MGNRYRLFGCFSSGYINITQQHVTNKSKMTNAWKLSHLKELEKNEEDITIKIEFKERRLEYGNCNC